MKYYEKLAEIGIFNYAYVYELTGNKSSAFDIIRNYQKKNLIKKIKHNLYGTISLENGGLISSKYNIASNVNDVSFISHHSAFEFYGYYNQVYYTVNTSSLRRFHNFEFDGYTYHFHQTKTDYQVDLIRGIKITSLERTIVDSIKDFDKISDIEEVLKCIELIPIIDENKLMQYLDHLGIKLLYKKVGFILSYFKEDLFISEDFFNKCKKLGGKVIGNISNLDKSILVFNSEWKLYTYQNLLGYLGRGENTDV